ncbi:MAG: dihydrodipicolinate synthase family protein [Cohaesibacter sp.]|nr:dihydrodipicolinate synthase family protein [Cohaesibacter sp.]
MIIQLPNVDGKFDAYEMSGSPIAAATMSPDACRVVYSAAHVVADPFRDVDPSGPAAIDWEATMAFRRHLADLGLGIAEAMDTAQRGMGLDWAGALELIRRTKQEVPHARVASGVGTDHLDLADVSSLDQVKRAYLEQMDAVQKLDSQLIVMASRALAKVAQTSDDYLSVYRDVLSHADQPVVLHWLGEMFDPALAGYWGGHSFEDALATALEVIEQNKDKVDGIKISLLDKDKEIRMRRMLPAGVKMYTGDDFNYPDLIAGDEKGYSHALLGIFDPLAPAAAHAITCLDKGDVSGFHATLDPTVPMARHIFRSPTQYYKTGVVFLAWLNGFQDHFIMLNGHHAMRSLPYFVDLFKMADGCGLLAKPELAMERMKKLLSVYGC